MIWGEFINLVRSTHRDFIAEFRVSPKAVLPDPEWEPQIPFPEAIDDFDEWNELALSPELQDTLPLHPVERAFVEGPLLPIQRVKFHSKKEVETLCESFLKLELEWLESQNLKTPERVQFFERAKNNLSLKLSTQLGFNRLARVPTNPS